MSFFNGLVSGVNQGLQQTRAENAKRSAEDQEREDRILQHLSTSDDPEIASMALAGMLDRHTGKPSKGLRGFLGEMQGNPALPTIQDLIRKGKATPNAPPEGEVPQALSPSMEGGAAMPQGSAVTPGGPPMRMPGPTQFHQEPRTVFLSPEERAGRQQEATVRGKLSAFRAGMRDARTPEEQELVRNLSGGNRLASQYKPVTLELDNGDGTTSTTAGYFDGRGGYFDDEYTPLTNVKRILTGSGTTAPHFLGQLQGHQVPAGAVDINGVALTPTGYYRQELMDGKVRYVPTAGPASLQRPSFQVLTDAKGRPAAYRVYPDGRPSEFVGYKPVRDEYLIYTDPATQQQYSVPAPALFERPGQAVEGIAHTPGGAGQGAVQPPPGNPASALAADGPPAAPASGQPPVASGSAAPPPTRPSGAPRGAVARGRSRNLAQVPGAILVNGDAQEATALYDAGVGKYYDPKDPAKEYQGFIPGKEAATAAASLGNLTATESTLDRAIQAIDAAGLAQDNDPQTTAQLTLKYRGGSAEDPFATAVAALGDFSRIQGASQFVRGTRAYAYFKDIQQHLPRLPGTRAAVLNKVTGGLAGPLTADTLLGEGHSWDSPKLMREKLELAKTNIGTLRQALQEAGGKTPGQAVGGPPAAAGAASGTPAASPPPQHPNSALPDGAEFLGPDGKTYVKTGTNPDGTIRGRLKGGR